MSEKKTRKPNWTELEMEVLSDAYRESIRIIRGKFSPFLTAEMKKQGWFKITERVNAVSCQCLRTVEEPKKRWQDVQSYVKKKESSRKRELMRTGGGPPPVEVPFKPWEEIVLSTIPHDAIYGIEGAADTGPDHKGDMYNVKSGDLGHAPGPSGALGSAPGPWEATGPAPVVGL